MSARRTLQREHALDILFSLLDGENLLDNWHRVPTHPIRQSNVG